jgi:hypothetical protein
MPVYLISPFLGGVGWYLDFGGLAQGRFLWPFFMALFHKQNTAGENPLVRRVAQRGGDLCKTRPRGFKSLRNNFKFYPWFTRLPRQPSPRWPWGLYHSHELPPSPPPGQRANCPIPPRWTVRRALGEVHIPRSPDWL